MVTFKSVLPSGRAIHLEKLTTRQYRAVSERVVARMGDQVNALQMTNRLSHEMLLASLRGITAAPVEMKLNEKGDDVDFDASIDSIPEGAWLRPTFEQLVTEGDLSLDALLDEPADYLAAAALATGEILGGGGSALRGKVKREFVER